MLHLGHKTIFLDRNSIYYNSEFNFFQKKIVQKSMKNRAHEIKRQQGRIYEKILRKEKKRMNEVIILNHINKR